MRTRYTSTGTRNGGPFHKALEFPFFSLEKLTQCKAGNPNIKWTFPHKKTKEQKKRMYFKKRIFIESREFGINWDNLQCRKGLTIMIILTKVQLAGPSNIAN